MRASQIPAALLLLILNAPAVAQESTSCTQCHGDPDLFGQDGAALVHDFSVGVHSATGISCHSCHGGNPDPALSEDMVAAMDPDFTENPYVGKPQRTRIPQFCGKCHSDPVFMKRFRPDVRVDIEQEYWTSQHGSALKMGDEAVATCIDCHGVHGILKVADINSPVYASNVADTCARCHSDPERMAGRKNRYGQEMPINQYALWKVSVHAEALTERDDLYAPTCNDCHGNHGAVPPGLDSITFVCGQCHGREAELFRKSNKHSGFEMHNELLREMDGPACEACHEMPEAFEQIAPVYSLSECSSCHGNHAIRRPTVGMFPSLPESPCAFCHEPLQEKDHGPLADSRRPSAYEGVLNALIKEGRALDLEKESLFDWLVEQTLKLETHTVSGSSPDKPDLRPEFARLFEKFRIGKTTFRFREPVTGEETSRPVVRCSHCHSPEKEESPASVVGKTLLERVRRLTSLTGGAERLLLKARRGGVETRKALEALDQAVDAQIRLQVQVHSFNTQEGEAFQETYQQGLEYAQNSFSAGEEALKELQFRRKGLGVSLIFIVAVLVGLGLKIRQIGN